MIDEQPLNFWNNLLSDLGSFLGITQVNSFITIINTIIGILSTLVAIWIFVTPTIKAQRRKKQRLKLQAQKQRNHSPYVTGQAVTPPQFVGRKSELQLLQTSLLSHESLSLLGDRRIGKSSLLMTWRQSLLNDHYSVTVLNGQNGEGESLQHCLQTILQQAVSADISADDAANQLVQWATQQAASHDKKPVILVDECEAIIQQCPYRFWERMRGALGQIVWVFASRKPLDTLYTQYHQRGSPFDNQLKTLWLGLLDQSAAETLIAKGQFLEQQQAFMRHWAGCHPFYLQALGDRLWANKAATDTTEALDAYQMDSQRHLRDLWRGLSKPEQAKLLDFMLSQQPIDDIALRSRGVITRRGLPFAEILNVYLRDQYRDKP